MLCQQRVNKSSDTRSYVRILQHICRVHDKHGGVSNAAHAFLDRKLSSNPGHKTNQENFSADGRN